MPEEKQKAAAPAQSGASDDGLFGALCYIIIVLVPLFVLFTEKKSNKFLAFHAWQSLIFSVLWIAVWIGLSVVTLVAGAVSGVGALVGCLFLPLFAVIVIVGLFAAYKAYQGEKYKLPIIGDFAEKQVK